MKLYYSPGACALHVQIVAREAGVALELVGVDLATKRTERGEDLIAINPKGQVPTLVLDDGTVLTEGAALVQYIADTAGARTLLPAIGTIERYRVLATVNFISAELHKGFAPLFKASGDEVLADARANLRKALDVLSAQLGDRATLVGDAFTVADAYAFNVLTWAKPAGLDLARWPNLKAFMERTSKRPTVRDSLVAEGLLKVAKAA